MCCLISISIRYKNNYCNLFLSKNNTLYYNNRTTKCIFIINIIKILNIFYSLNTNIGVYFIYSMDTYSIDSYSMP